MKRSSGLAIVAALISATVAAQAQDPEGELRQEMESLRQGQEEIRKELAEIKRLLQAQWAVPAAQGPNVRGKTFSVAGNPVKGETSAELTLIEFMDYQCGYCGRHLRETYPQIAAEYVDSGKLRYAVLDLPLERSPVRGLQGRDRQGAPGARVALVSADRAISERSRVQ